MSLYLVSWEVARRSFHLRAQELKHNLGEDVISSLPEVQTLWLLVKSRLWSSVAGRVPGSVEEG